MSSTIQIYINNSYVTGFLFAANTRSTIIWKDVHKIWFSQCIVEAGATVVFHGGDLCFGRDVTVHPTAELRGHVACIDCSFRINNMHINSNRLNFIDYIGDKWSADEMATFATNNRTVVYDGRLDVSKEYRQQLDEAMYDNYLFTAHSFNLRPPVFRTISRRMLGHNMLAILHASLRPRMKPAIGRLPTHLLRVLHSFLVESEGDGESEVEGESGGSEGEVEGSESESGGSEEEWEGGWGSEESGGSD